MFDVSHMGQGTVSGPDAIAAMERLCPCDLVGLKPGRQRYSLFTTASGGISDDFMIARIGENAFFLVVNAGCKEADFAHVAANLPAGTTLTRHDDRALLALQGPLAAEVFARLAPASAAMKFMDIADLEVAGIGKVRATRSGYTGEDGFEISVPADRAQLLASLLLNEPEVAPIGLGARDSLRLEAGLPLYGHDITTADTPIEAGLTFAINKRRKMDWNFLGGETIREELYNGPTRRRVGIRLDGRAPAREGAEIVSKDGEKIGIVTSGGFAPSLEAPIAMGYVKSPFANDGTEIALIVRGKPLPARVVPMPFVPNRYFR